MVKNLGTWSLEHGTPQTGNAGSVKQMNLVKEKLSQIKGILFDLDNTLYPSGKGVFDLVSERIDQYVMFEAGVDSGSVKNIREDFIAAYGTTLGGLIQHHSTSPEHFLDFVHDIPVESMLQADPGLETFLARIRLPKVIFTNASASHASRVLAALGVGGHFLEICDLVATGYLGKPHNEAFLLAVDTIGLPAGKTLFVDDMPANVDAAADLGIIPVLVEINSDGTDHLTVSKVTDLAEYFEGMPWFG